MLRNMASRAIFLKSARPRKTARPVVNIGSKLSAPNAWLCNIYTANHAFLQLVSNYVRLCTQARPAVHNPWPSNSSLLFFSRPFQSSFLLKSQQLAHHRGFELLSLRLQIEVPEKSRISPKQPNHECRGLETVKLPNKKRKEDRLKWKDRSCKIANIKVY